MRDENCRVVLFFCEQQATQGNSRHRESKKSWFFVYSSPFFIVLFFWHALASLFLLSFPEFRKMLKMSSFFRLAKDSKKVSPLTTFRSVLSFGWLWNDNEWWETKWWVNCSQVRQIKTGYEENEAQKKTWNAWMWLLSHFLNERIICTDMTIFSLICFLMDTVFKNHRKGRI